VQRFEIIASTLPEGRNFGRVATEDALVQPQMRWYNPKLEDFEWREVPNTDKEALSLLEGYAGAEGHAAVYEEWRQLGTDIMAALIRAGEAAKEEERGG
jgi:hypothetical protein